MDPGRSRFLGEVLKQILPDGEYRPRVERLLADEGFASEDLDDALERNEYVWNTEVQWANVLQVRLGESHIFYIAFYKDHQGAQNVPVDGAIVPNPSFTPPRPEPLFVDSSRALAFRETGEYAKCAQQALLDAGFDPNGVDGRPGGGARRALSAWSDANRITTPEFTQETASQVCYLLTSPTHRVSGPQGLVEDFVWPIWSGSIFYNDNHAQLGFILLDSEIQQVTEVNLAKELRFGDQGDRAVDLPWKPFGTLVLHGQDGLDGQDGGNYTVFSQDLRQLIREQTEETGRAVTSQMLGARARDLLRVLGSDGDAAPSSPDWSAFWTVVDRIGDDQIVVGDIELRPDYRVVMFYRQDSDGEDHQLLYATRVRVEGSNNPPSGQQQANASSSGFPGFNPDQTISGLFNADCQEATEPTRSQPIGEHDGFSAFPTRLCMDGNVLIDIVMWTKTNAEGTQLSAAATTSDGQGLSIVESFFDETSSSNMFRIGGLAINGRPVNCMVAKPNGGIAVFGESFCEE